VRCNDDGLTEASESCLLGCNGTEVRCNDMAPSNDLAPYLDMTAGEADIDLGTQATINTDNGDVKVDGNQIRVSSTLLSQSSAPVIRIFIVHSLVAHDVTVVGMNAIAIVSAGDVTIRGTFEASAFDRFVGPGAFNDDACRGKDAVRRTIGVAAGAGGGGFGGSGGAGGSVFNTDGTIPGGAGGMPSGNPELVPLRGGCDSGIFILYQGTGGGAVQLVSRTKITVVGVVAANGASVTGGGSGGGILLESPVVDVSGNVVANGGGGSGGCTLPLMHAEDGHLDATPAFGSACDTTTGAHGGNGGARSTDASAGANFSGGLGGHGGGGVGRIRVNALPGGFYASGTFSPNPSTGAIGTR
jgi:hypothetical protein